jgi:hypothetical protein
MLVSGNNTSRSHFPGCNEFGMLRQDLRENAVLLQILKSEILVGRTLVRIMNALDVDL